MPKGPQGQKRPGDVIGAAIKVAKIATGEVKDTMRDVGKEYMRKGGLKGGKTRMKNLSEEERKDLALLAAKARWKKS